MSSARRRRKNKKGAAEPPLTGPAASINDLSDDLLKLILLRLDSSVWLARAASTSKRWVGIIAADDCGAAFLGLSRALHPPAIAGHFLLGGTPKDFIPSSPPSIAGNPCSSLDFLPGVLGDKNKMFGVADCYGGLVLLFDEGSITVCDPLSRLWKQVPYPPNWEQFDGDRLVLIHDAAALMDGEAEGGISLSNFRIICGCSFDPGNVDFVDSCVFSTADDVGWRALKHLDGFRTAHVAGRVDGSLFLRLKSGRLTVLDKARLEFSKVDLPTTADPNKWSSFRVVHSSGAGMEPQIVRVVHVNLDFLEVFRRDNGGWRLEHSVPRLSEFTRKLPGHPGEKLSDWIVEAVGDGPSSVVLSARHGGQRCFVFSVHMETMEVAAVPDEKYPGPTCSYTLPWPLFQGVRRSRRCRRTPSIH